MEQILKYQSFIIALLGIGAAFAGWCVRLLFKLNATFATTLLEMSNLRKEFNEHMAKDAADHDALVALRAQLQAGHRISDTDQSEAPDQSPQSPTAVKLKIDRRSQG